MLDQAAIVEEIGRVTNALGWCYGGAGLDVRGLQADQLERFVLPMMRGERHFCYAITEEGAGSDVEDIATTARREGDHYVIDGEKWHVTSANLAMPVVQAKRRRRPWPVLLPPSARHRALRSPAYTHTYGHHHPILAFAMSRCRQPTGSARRATAWASPMPGSAASA